MSTENIMSTLSPESVAEIRALVEKATVIKCRRCNGFGEVSFMGDMVCCTDCGGIGRYEQSSPAYNSAFVDLCTTAIAALLASHEALRAEVDRAYRAACRLLNALHPGLQRLPDTAGVITQIDNCTVGIRDTAAREMREACAELMRSFPDRVLRDPTKKHSATNFLREANGEDRAKAILALPLPSETKETV